MNGRLRSPIPRLLTWGGWLPDGVPQNEGGEQPWLPDPIPADASPTAVAGQTSAAPHDRVSGVVFKRAAAIKSVCYTPESGRGPERCRQTRTGRDGRPWLFSGRPALRRGCSPVAALHTFRIFPLVPQPAPRRKPIGALIPFSSSSRDAVCSSTARRPGAPSWCAPCARVTQRSSLDQTLRCREHRRSHIAA